MNKTERKLDKLGPIKTYRTPEEHRKVIQPKTRPFTGWQDLPSHPSVNTPSKAEKRRRRKERRVALQKQIKIAVVTRAMKDAFYDSWDWKHKRLEAIKRDGRRCLCCGAGPDHGGVRIVVDHIKPLGEFWELRLDINNLQVLCDDCNMGKGNRDYTDFRSKEPDEWSEEVDSLMAEFREIMRQ